MIIKSEGIQLGFDHLKRNTRKRSLQLFPHVDDRIRRCECCGDCDYIKIHHKNYNEPYDIIWLCESCHCQFHLLLRDNQDASLEDLRAYIMAKRPNWKKFIR